MSVSRISHAVRGILLAAFVLAALTAAAPHASAVAGDPHTTSVFQGVKANTGTVTHSKEGGKSVLTFSADFKVPDAPAPSWQVVDSQGNVYLLNQIKVKSGINRSVTVPSYVPDIAKVQIWCSYAEVLLGEASFPSPVK
jgi:hypothetical protein